MLGSGISDLIESTLGQIISQTAKKSIGGAVTGAAVGGAIGGRKGAIAGGAIGAVGGAGGLQQLATIFKSDAAMGTPRIAAKAAAEYSTAFKQTGQKLENLYSDVTEKLPEKNLLPNPQLKQQILDNLLPDVQKGEPLRSQGYDNAVKRTLERWFGDSDKALTPEALHKTAVGMNKEANSFNARKLSTNAQAMTDVARELRNQLDEYVVQTNDSSLVQQATDLKKSYSTLAKGMPVVNKALNPQIRSKALQAGQAEVARVIGLGPKVLGKKSYDMLVGASARGLSAAAVRYAHMLYENASFRQIIEDNGVLDQTGFQQELPSQ